MANQANIILEAKKLIAPDRDIPGLVMSLEMRLFTSIKRVVEKIALGNLVVPQAPFMSLIKTFATNTLSGTSVDITNLVNQAEPLIITRPLPRVADANGNTLIYLGDVDTLNNLTPISPDEFYAIESNVIYTKSDPALTGSLSIVGFNIPSVTNLSEQLVPYVISDLVSSQGATQNA